MKRKREYLSYDEYAKHQAEKSSDVTRRSSLLKNFKNKVEIFKSRFSYSVDKYGITGEALCLGARMGEEVEAFMELGMNAIGIDLVAAPPLVIEGDFNNLQFESSKFDVVYANVIDHAWDIDLFLKNITRVLKHDGLLLIDIFPGTFNSYEVFEITEKETTETISAFDGLTLLDKNKELKRIYKATFPEIHLIFRCDKN